MKYDYPFTNSIVFALVMRDRELCRQLLQIIFPEREIEEVRMHEEFTCSEQTIIVGIESRKVRLDVLFKDSNAWYDIEMQVRDEGNLPKRTRYAHAAMDVDYLKAGQCYNTLKPSYVIFLCCFDFFGQNQPVYRFRMVDEDNHLPLSDETYTIVLNSKAEKAASTPQELRELFQYMNKSIVAEDNDFLKQIDYSVESWNTGEGRNMIMTLEQEIMIKEAKAREEGRAEGLVEGKKEGVIDILAQLAADDMISIEEAAKRADMTTEDFQAAIESYRQLTD